MTKLTRFLFLIAPLVMAGCQQKMAEQPAPRPYEASKHFPNGQSARPLEFGVVHRGQKPDSDPMVTGLTEKGLKSKGGDWSGAKAYDVMSVVPPAGAPDTVENFVTEFPFPITAADLHRGQQRYNIYCALCHGAAGDAMGKIAERGYLRPPSYHTDPAHHAMDYSTTGQPSTGLPRGYSRGFYRYYNHQFDEQLVQLEALQKRLAGESNAGKKAEIEKEIAKFPSVDALKASIAGQKKDHLIALDKVPVGYIFQVITWGFGGMPDHASQIPPDDRWRIVAYIRALQLSQGAPVDKLPPEDQKKLADKKPNEPKH